MIFFLTFLIIDKNAVIFFIYVITYIFFLSNLLFEPILDLGKRMKKKTCIFTFMPFLVRALPEVQNDFQKNIWLISKT